MKTFVIGDIHGAYRAMLQCFERSGFNYAKDHLISLGDVCDRYPQVDSCIDELLKVKHLDYIIGNHDLWTLGWAIKGIKENLWLRQGGKQTIESYHGRLMPQSHIDFLKNACYYLELNDRLFIHGGFDPEKPLAAQDREGFPWDRKLIQLAYKVSQIRPDYQLGNYKEIYVGHTPTKTFGALEPLKLCNVWALDTAAGWKGKLTIMDVDTKEYWQSDPTSKLYPNATLRR